MNRRQPIYNLYVDDSGTRNPSSKSRSNEQDRWFALGGVLVSDDHVEQVKKNHSDFCSRWSIHYPLHSVEIRHKKDNFSWLANMPQVEERRFYRDLASLMTKSPILGHACVIDRAGYQARYDAKYGSERWHLCKTAFSVLVERAAKFADARGCRLRIFVEYSDRTSDRRIKEYYKDMKANGLPSSSDTSSRYNPLSNEQLSFILLDLQFKNKKHPLLQMADLALYPMCKDKYGFYQPMRDLVKHKRVIDAVLAPAEQDTLGIKYSCFDR